MFVFAALLLLEELHLELDKVSLDGAARNQALDCGLAPERAILLREGPACRGTISQRPGHATARRTI